MIWTLPSVIALALTVKGLLFFYSDVHKKKYFFLFLVGTFLLNLLELISFFQLGYDLILVKLHYCTAVFTLLYLILMCSNVSQSSCWIRSKLLMSAATVLAAITLFSDYIVLDSIILPNGSPTRVSGSYYFVFQAYAMITLIFSFFLLINKLIKSTNYHLKAQCLTALLAFTPCISITIIIISLMHFGYPINIVGILSVAICIMLVVFISLTDKDKLFTMMSFVPRSRERAYRLKLRRILKEFNNPINGSPVQMKTLLKELESLVIEHTQDYFTTQKEVAHMLDISEGSLSRKKSQK